jgi:hypothetical protein
MAEDRDLSKFDIFRVDYRTAGQGASATELVAAIFENLRPTLHKYDSVYFVCHSLGGNLMLDYLVALKLATPNPHAYIKRHRGLFLLGTPLHGSNVARYAAWVNGTEALRVLTPIRDNDFQQLTLKNFSLVQQRLRSLYGTPIKIWVGYEMRPVVPGTPVIVTQESSNVFADTVEKQGFDRNHIDLVKPRSRADDVYKWVKEHLLKDADQTVLRSRASAE